MAWHFDIPDTATVEFKRRSERLQDPVLVIVDGEPGDDSARYASSHMLHVAVDRCLIEGGSSLCSRFTAPRPFPPRTAGASLKVPAELDGEDAPAAAFSPATRGFIEAYRTCAGYKPAAWTT